ncbi:hypothetical protein M378DRAFT_48155, partial [Amanita muscaria Koide BX008]
DELQHYLSSDLETPGEGPLKWWRSKQQVYPRLSLMALNYLSIPATSVDVERVFSKGRLVLSHVRNRLSAETMRAIMCLGAWTQANLITKKDVVDII